ncbi:hypothetical protein FB451DRAFT_1269013 [Mycena latifolia]|nr:hypothetical protein FB451DRAFT_1269013 [Mycena latifolia]
MSFQVAQIPLFEKACLLQNPTPFGTSHERRKARLVNLVQASHGTDTRLPKNRTWDHPIVLLSAVPLMLPSALELRSLSLLCLLPRDSQMGTRELESGILLGRKQGNSILNRLGSLFSRNFATLERQNEAKFQTNGEEIQRDGDNYTAAENSESCTGIWSIYVSEAERYDTALVESWKADMEGMLIFSGLFSASLTAFVIESYKNLRPQSGDLTVAALSQVSKQLAAMASGRDLVAEAAQSFRPTTESLICNALWFISLSLSLMCALLATLVEQWAREFLHKTERRPSPVRRARVFSFLYFGLKRFRMHAVVDAIPFLLHASLLLFFAGLLTFLIPVNALIMRIVAVVLLVFLALYSALTILPIVSLDCPYRTPLSTPLWALILRLPSFSQKIGTWKEKTIAEAVAIRALDHPEERDQRALQWTLNSLIDESQFLPFVEAIPIALHGSNGFRLTNDYLFLSTFGDTERASSLITRIGDLLASTRRLHPDDPVRIHRWNACLKAVWALALLPTGWQTRFDTQSLREMLADTNADPVHNPSVLLALRHHDQMWCRHLLAETRDLLSRSDASSEASVWKMLPKLRRLLALILQQQDILFHPTGYEMISPNSFSQPLEDLNNQSSNMDSGPSRRQLEQMQATLNTLHDSPDWMTNKIEIVTTFLCNAFAFPDATPFEPIVTCDRILGDLPPSGAVNRPAVTRGVHFQNITRVFNPPSFRNGLHQLDMFVRIAFRLLPFLPADKTHLFWYLTYRNNTEAVRYALQDCDKAELSKSLVDNLQRSGPSFDDVLHAATVVVGVFPHPEAIHFAQGILAGASATVPSSLSPLRTIKDIRTLEELDWNVSLRELESPQFSPEYMASAEKILESVRRNGVLRPPDPGSGSPRPSTLCGSIETQIANIYLGLLARLLDNCASPPTVVISTTLFGLLARKRYSTSPMIVWTDIYPDTQKQIFSAIQDFVAYLSHPHKPTDPHMFDIARNLWSSGLFWRIDFSDTHRSPNLIGIQPQYMEVMVKSLRIYVDFLQGPTDGTEIGDCSNVLLDCFGSIYKPQP